MSSQQITAWMVHAYTATGGLVGMLALFEAADGRIHSAFLLLFITLLIDATDGMMARRARVREILPHVDGAMVDNVIDVLTFVWVPVFIMWRYELLPHPVWLIIPVFAALYAYSQSDMKTGDDFFLGFPSYWNIIALYLYLLNPPALAAVLLVLIPGILTFIPTRYLYPSKNHIFWKTSSALFLLWVLMILYILSQPVPSMALVWGSLFYPAYYMALSFYIDWQIRSGRLSYSPT